MTHLELRQKFLDFWRKKKHKEIPSASLVPENDPSVLFTTAGMHPLVPYLLGQPHPLGKRLVDVQKCLRTNDIDEVGDAFHHTFFEMMGHWSLGDYFKKEVVPWSFELLTKEFGLDPNRIWVTCFAGDGDAPKDEVSAGAWRKVGIPEERIFFYGKSDNWWGPAGETGPCGPDTEMFYDVTQKPCGPNCQPNCGCGRFSELANDVFMEYNKTADKKFEKLTQPNVDNGTGLERNLSVINGLKDDYLTDLWLPAIKKIEELSGKKYSENLKPFRIIADHIRASIFAIADGVTPSNKQQGYILRRLIRRSVVQAKQLGLDPEKLNDISDIYIEIMSPFYPELKKNTVLMDEIVRFEKSLDKGLKEFEKIKAVTGKDAFDLFQTYGFPWELTAEMAAKNGQKINREEFQREFKNHQERSRTASAGMFKGGLADHSEIVTKYHTATHLLHAALRQVLGNDVHQAGSNLTAERLRFDFSFPRKLTDKEVEKVTQLVNEAINGRLSQKIEVMTYDEAIKSGALAFFKDKYPEKVTVYSFGPSTGSGSPFSREICGGPHVENTKTLGTFKVIKEEAVSAGVRRIYGKIQN
jgi:alanyl-tRNA synthetase